MKDFSFQAYKHLIQNLKNSGFCFFDHELQNTDSFQNGVIIRHDVDRKPLKALKMAEIEKDLGVKSIYFFRTTADVFKPEIMKRIAAMGHEIGYHYESLSVGRKLESTRARKQRKRESEEGSKARKQESNEGLKVRRLEETLHSQIVGKSNSQNNSRLTTHVSREFEQALYDFVSNLDKFKELVQVRFIAAHGSPRSPFDNRDLWKYFDYKDFGIESDFSIIKDEMLYITDAGRSWNNLKVNRRDVSNMENFPDVKSIFEIPEVIQASGSGTVMLNIHPEHWVDSKAEWVYIYLYRKVRNALKRIYLAVFSRRRGERGLESLKAGRTRARKREGGKV